MQKREKVRQKALSKRRMPEPEQRRDIHTVPFCRYLGSFQCFVCCCIHWTIAVVMDIECVRFNVKNWLFCWCSFQKFQSYGFSSYSSPDLHSSAILQFRWSFYPPIFSFTSMIVLLKIIEVLGMIWAFVWFIGVVVGRHQFVSLYACTVNL